jgi:3-methyl-2-oxobutanoate hydroxymethyltransferase
MSTHSKTLTFDTSTSRANPTPSPMKRLTVPRIRQQKGKEPLVMLTAYTVRMAQLMDPHCDMLLVGDSLGQVIYGLPHTVAVTMEMMAAHGAAVVRGSYHAAVIVDMPFGSYEASPEQAFVNASRLLKETGAAAVKLEGGKVLAPTVEFLTSRGIPVMAHVGLTPQAVNTLGGYKVVGRDDEADRVMQDALAVQAAGAFSVVLEKVPMGLAGRITKALDIPTIGIGAGADCDGQVLVIDDMLGLFTEFRPKFVKRFAELGRTADEAIAAYAAEVRTRAFPADEHGFPDVLPAKGPTS